MSVWGANLLFAASVSIGIWLLISWRKRRGLLLLISGITAVLISIACIMYLAAVMFLVDGIQ
jgi:hypothetical protein